MEGETEGLYPRLHLTLMLILARIIDNFNGNRHHQFVLKAVDVAMQAAGLLDRFDRGSGFEPRIPVGDRI